MHALVFTVLTVLLAAAAPAQGRYLYAPAVHRSLAQQKVVASWDEARRHCERDGAMLASPVTTELLAQMETYIDVNNHAAAYFIGVRAELDPGYEGVRYVSVEGSRLDDMPEGVVNMIEQIDPRDGECLCMDRRQIRAVPCWERLPFICYTNETVPTSTTVQPTAADLGYEYYSETGHWYKPHNRYVTANEARAACEREGGYLVVLDDRSEAGTVTGIMISNDFGATWTGLLDRRPGGESDWRSVRGEPISELWDGWHEGRSYNEELPVACADLFAMELYDNDCDTTTFRFICERDE